jgi:hypothetical protein
MLAQILLDPVIVDQRVVDVEEEDHIVHLLLISMLRDKSLFAFLVCWAIHLAAARSCDLNPAAQRRDLCKPLRAFARWRASMLVWTCRAKTARLS